MTKYFVLTFLVCCNNNFLLLQYYLVKIQQNDHQ